MSEVIIKMDLAQKCLGDSWTRQHENLLVRDSDIDNIRLAVRYCHKKKMYECSFHFPHELIRYLNRGATIRLTEPRTSNAENIERTINTRLLHDTNRKLAIDILCEAMAHFKHAIAVDTAKAHCEVFEYSGTPFYQRHTSLDLGTYQKLAHFLNWIDANRDSLAQHMKELKDEQASH